MSVVDYQPPPALTLLKQNQNQTKPKNKQTKFKGTHFKKIIWLKE